MCVAKILDISLIVLPKCDCSFLIATVCTVALFGTLPMFMLSKSVVHGELACVAFGAFRLILTIFWYHWFQTDCPLYDEIRKRMLTFIQNCLLLSESDLVSIVTRHAVWFGCMSSPLGRNAFHCCRQFDVHLDNLIDVALNFVYIFFKF